MTLHPEDHKEDRKERKWWQGEEEKERKDSKDNDDAQDAVEVTSRWDALYIQSTTHMFVCKPENHLLMIDLACRL